MLGGLCSCACAYAFGGETAQAALAFAVLGILTVVALMDMDTLEIYDRFPVLLFVCGIAAHILIPSLGIKSRLIGCVIVSVPMLLLALIVPGGFGGGDIKLAGATGLVLGLPASLTASCLGLTGFVMYGCMVCLWNRFKGKRDKEAFPVGPFLAGGAAAVYCMRLGGWMI